jgi:hypothetical protein
MDTLQRIEKEVKKNLASKGWDISSDYFDDEFRAFLKDAIGATIEVLRQPKNIGEKSSWVAVENGLPKPLQTIWLANKKGWVAIGCLVESDGGWHWAESNGVIYAENGEIISECESEDLDVEFWQELPKMP